MRQSSVSIRLPCTYSNTQRKGRSPSSNVTKSTTSNSRGSCNLRNSVLAYPPPSTTLISGLRVRNCCPIRNAPYRLPGKGTDNPTTEGWYRSMCRHRACTIHSSVRLMGRAKASSRRSYEFACIARDSAYRLSVKCGASVACTRSARSSRYKVARCLA